MQLHSDDVLVQNRDVWDLLSGRRVSLVKVLDEFSGAENVIQVERSCQSRIVFIDIPVLIVLFEARQELVNLRFGQWLAVLIVGTAFLASFATNVLLKERFACQGADLILRLHENTVEVYHC